LHSLVGFVFIARNAHLNCGEHRSGE
jgi:hypothetical protein